MNTAKKPITLLFNPFVYIAGAQALGLGLAAVLLAGLIGALGRTHYDGVLDVHPGAADAPLWFFLSEGVIGWLCLSLVLWILGKIISRTSFRTIDLLGTQALARWPTVLISLVTLPKAMQRFSDAVLEQLHRGGPLQFNTADAIIVFAVIAAMIPLYCWMIRLMYKSFSVSCNVKGGKAIWTFIGGLIVAEVLSKLAIVGLFMSMPAAPLHAATSANQTVRIQGIPGDWLVLRGHRDQWNWTNNTLTGHSTTGDTLLASTKQYGDVTVSATVSTTNREASLALRFQDADNGYLAVFVPDGTAAAVGVGPRITLLKRQSGVEQELAMFKKPGLSAPGQLEELTFSAKGPQLEVRLNDVPVLTATDPAFSSGFIGLRVCGDSSLPCDGTFSNLTIR